LRTASRVSVAAIFIVSGLAKIAGPAATAGYIASKGLPFPFVGALAAGALELVAGVCVAFGIRVRHAALALVAFLALVTPLFHNPLASGAVPQLEVMQVLKNLAIAGALLYLTTPRGARS
jgi:putative oxidoreductase